MPSRYPWRRGLGWVGAVGIAAGALAVIAGKPQPAVDEAEYQAIMAEEAGAPAVLQQRFEEQRWLSLPLLPPGPEITLALPLGGRVVPFDWKRFPKEFVAGLDGRWENSVPVYDLTLAEDPLTHETLFLNATGEPILRLPAPSWSDPTDLRQTLATLYGVVPGSADTALLDPRLWDPARLQARLTLIRPEDVEYYLYAEARVRDYAASLQSAVPPPVMMLMGGESEFCIAAVQRATNGIRLEIELPDGFTNRVDVFGSTNLVAFEWSVLADGLSTTGGSPLVWTDSPLPATLRFYAAGDADTDSDLDGLTDAREVFLHRTCPTNLDTDADGLVDGNSGVVGTNLYAAGVQSNGFVLGELTLGTSQILADSDDDGVSDGVEVAGGTDPLDPNLPPNVNGTVLYSGLQTGTVRVIAVAVSGSWSTARQAALPAPGAYRIANLPPSNWWIRAFVDSNGDGTNDAPEARGEWATSAPVTSRVTGIDFELADPDDDADGLPDWWEILHWSDIDTEDGEGDPDADGYLNREEHLARTDPEDDASHPFNIEGTVSYSGPLEGSIVVLASTSAVSWAAAGSVTVNATGTFAILHLPVGASYWVKAFRDSDEDGVFDFGERAHWIDNEVQVESGDFKWWEDPQTWAARRMLSSNEVSLHVAKLLYRFRVLNPETGTVYRLTVGHFFTPEGVSTSLCTMVTNISALCATTEGDLYLGGEGILLPPPAASGLTFLSAMGIGFGSCSSYSNATTGIVHRYQPATIPSRWATNCFTVHSWGLPDGTPVGVKYRRSGSVQNVAWADDEGDLIVSNGSLCVAVALFDGSNSSPRMAMTDALLAIDSVQQGDTLIFVAFEGSCSNSLHVVKNFTWNDLVRLGLGNLEMAAEYQSMSEELRAAIVSSVVFMLDPRAERAQATQRTNDTMPGIMSADFYHGFTTNSVYTNLCRLDIPSALSIGWFPQDANHLHFGLGVHTGQIPSVIADLVSDLESAAAPYIPPPLAGTSEVAIQCYASMQDATTAAMIALANAFVSETNETPLVYHSYEGGGGALPADYVDPQGAMILLAGDPIRNVKCDAGNGTPNLFYPGQPDDAGWTHDPPCDPLGVVGIVISGSGKIRLIHSPNIAFFEHAVGQIHDACERE